MKVSLKPNEAYDVVTDRLRAEGFQAYAVGGCVRDAVVGVECNDIDVATNARPHDLTKVFGVRQWDGDAERRVGTGGVVLYPTGVRHGTWTVRVGDDEVEVTTFRRDVETDGRNATVAFADNVEQDAIRRDFTMNALYLDQNHEVMDPTGSGLSDLLAGRVRFVGNAEDRVKEDYLRILRLFRFHARFGRGAMDMDAWNAASEFAYLIPEKVSGERVWDETRKILSLHSPFEAAAEMQASSVFECISDHWDTGALGKLLANERDANAQPRWTRRYAALCGRSITLPCSNAERKEVESVYDAVRDPQVSQAVSAYKYGDVAAFDRCLIIGATPNHREITRGLESVMPVTSQDWMDRGHKPGKELGDLMRLCEAMWIQCDLVCGKARLMELVDGTR